MIKNQLILFVVIVASVGSNFLLSMMPLVIRGVEHKKIFSLLRKNHTQIYPHHYGVHLSNTSPRVVSPLHTAYNIFNFLEDLSEKYKGDKQSDEIQMIYKMLLEQACAAQKVHTELSKAIDAYNKRSFLQKNSYNALKIKTAYTLFHVTNYDKRESFYSRWKKNNPWEVIRAVRHVYDSDRINTELRVGIIEKKMPAYYGLWNKAFIVASDVIKRNKALLDPSTDVSSLTKNFLATQQKDLEKLNMFIDALGASLSVNNHQKMNE